MSQEECLDSQGPVESEWESRESSSPGSAEKEKQGLDIRSLLSTDHLYTALFLFVPKPTHPYPPSDCCLLARIAGRQGKERTQKSELNLAKSNDCGELMRLLQEVVEPLQKMS